MDDVPSLLQALHMHADEKCLDHVRDDAHRYTGGYPYKISVDGCFGFISPNWNGRRKTRVISISTTGGSRKAVSKAANSPTEDCHNSPEILP